MAADSQNMSRPRSRPAPPATRRPRAIPAVGSEPLFSALEEQRSEKVPARSDRCGQYRCSGRSTGRGGTDAWRSQPAPRRLARAASSAARSAAAVIWYTRAGESSAAAASLRIEIPSARADASAQARSRSAWSRRHAPEIPAAASAFPPPGGHPVRHRHDDTASPQTADQRFSLPIADFRRTPVGPFHDQPLKLHRVIVRSRITARSAHGNPVPAGRTGGPAPATPASAPPGSARPASTAPWPPQVTGRAGGAARNFGGPQSGHGGSGYTRGAPE